MVFSPFLLFWLFELGLENLDHLLSLLQLEVGACGDLLDGQLEHALGRVAAGSLQASMIQPSISSANSVRATSSSSISR